MLLGLVCGLTADSAAGQLICSFTQLTDSVGETVGAPRLAAGGQHAVWPVETAGQTVVRRLDLTTGELRVLGAEPGRASDRPAVSADGRWVGLRSNANLAPGAPGNHDANREIFLWDAVDDSYRQVTSTIGDFDPIVGPRIADGGRRLVFSSPHDLIPPNNPDATTEVFLFDADSGLLTQVTATVVGPNLGAALSGDGQRLVFLSPHDLVPGVPGNADGGREVFSYDPDSGETVQLTAGVDGSVETPEIDRQGRRVAFASTRDIVPGSPGNPDGTQEIFLWDGEVRSFTQISFAADGSSFSPALDTEGDRLAFVSTATRPGNADGNAEIYLWDAATGTVAPVTDTRGGSNLDPSLAGERIVFRSDRDLTPGSPGNADGNFEIFLADCGFVPLQQIPTLSAAAACVLMVLLAGFGVLWLRRSSLGRREGSA